MSNFVSTRQHTALDDYRLSLVGQMIKGSDRPPMLRPQAAADGALKLSIYTNKPDDTMQKGQMNLVLGGADGFLLLDTIIAIAKGDAGAEAIFEIHDHLWKDKKKSEDVKLQYKLKIGKTEEGLVYMGVSSYSDARPKPRFIFMNNRYKVLSGTDGSPLSQAQISARWAVAWAEAVKAMYSGAVSLVYKSTEERKAARLANNGGGGGNGGGGNAGGGYSPAPSDDDW